MDRTTEKIIIGLGKEVTDMSAVLRDIKRYLEAGAIKTKNDRDFCIKKINDVLPEDEFEKLQIGLK